MALSVLGWPHVDPHPHFRARIVRQRHAAAAPLVIVRHPVSLDTLFPAFDLADVAALHRVRATLVAVVVAGVVPAVTLGRRIMAVRGADDRTGDRRSPPPITAADLVQVPEGTLTEAGLRTNISVAIQYIAAWLCGRGAVPINNLMEDAATAEISRAQLWQWLHHQAKLDNGQTVTAELFHQTLKQEMEALAAQIPVGDFTKGRYIEAAELLDKLVISPQFVTFLTLPGYELLD